MKKILFACAALFLFTSVLKADPPKKITLVYSAETKKLSIEVYHPVQKVEDHFIDMISISVDGKEVKVLKPLKQTNEKSELDVVLLPEIKAGSLVKVKARCNRFGTKSTDLKI